MDPTCDPDAVRHRERWAVWSILPAIAVLGALTGFSRTDIRASTPLIVTTVVVTALACACVPLLVRRPVAGAVALAALAAVSPAATPAASMGVLRVASERPLRTALAIGGVSTVAHAVQGVVRPVPGVNYGWWLVIALAVNAAVVAWGALAQAWSASRAEARRRVDEEQAARIAAARRQERATIAREMHDVLGHRLSLVAASAGALEYRPDAPAEQIARAAGVVRAGAHQALEELREVIGVLRADELTGVSGDAPPQPTAADIPALVDESREAGVSVAISCAVSEDVPETLGRTAYRIVQEGLTNARRHAAGSPVSVDVTGAAGGVLRVAVVNALAGVVVADGRGTGLVGLAERAASLGGRLEHGPTGDGGFRLVAELPWPA